MLCLALLSIRGTHATTCTRAVCAFAGHHVSQLAGDRIRAAVVPGAAALDGSADVGGLLWDTFSSTHAALASGANIDCTFSGATATVSVLRGRTLTTAWVGDSRAVLGRQEEGAVRAYDLTNDHKPDLPEEHARINQSGGRVEPLLVRCRPLRLCRCAAYFLSQGTLSVPEQHNRVHMPLHDVV